MRSSGEKSQACTIAQAEKTLNGKENRIERDEKEERLSRSSTRKRDSHDFVSLTLPFVWITAFERFHYVSTR